MTAACRAGTRHGATDAAGLTRPARGTYWTPAELAGTLRRSTKTLRNWRYLGRGPKAVIVEGRPLYPAEHVDAYLADLH